MNVAIDVDNTLIIEDDRHGTLEKPEVVLNEDLLLFIIALRKLGVVTNLWLWSGGGREYAAHVARKFGVSHLFNGFWAKSDAEALKPDLVIDDQDVKLGLLNVRLGVGTEPTPWMGRG